MNREQIIHALDVRIGSLKAAKAILEHNPTAFKKRNMGEASRERIAAAQRKRWRIWRKNH
jgi:hypothetical protein